MEKVTFRELDPEDLHTCQHCQHSYHDIVNGKQCEFYGHIPTLNYIRPNDCGAYKSPYLSDYRRRPDMEKQIKKQQTQKQLIMKAKELMIGDWVLYNGQPKVVQMIDGYGDTELDDEILCDGMYHTPIEISPIPLMAEILEKNGFTRYRENEELWEVGVLRLDLGLFAVGINKGCGTGMCMMPHGIMTFYCNYVHELQHALRLCGVEKEIVL